ncbi:MAG: BamA/TamA family outer membrane protein [Myxococcales bacterium]|nr:BamA/TamA family outer membrane protein [Myxococcales bacterium]
MRLCRTSALASALLTLAAVAEARAGEPEAEPTATSSAAEDGLVRRERPEEGPGLEVGRLALRFPGALIELAFTPLLPVAVAMDKYHLLDRVIDLLTNDDKTIAFVPVVDPFNSSGLGLGGSLIYNEPLGSADRLVLLGLMRTNRDRNFSIHLSRRVPTFSGRTLSLGASYSADHDTRYFGIGQERTKDDQRIIRTDAVNASFSFTLLNPARLPEYDAEVEVAYRRRRLGLGTGTRAPVLVENDNIPLPAGFGQVLDYPELTLSLLYDSRDSLGRTTRGMVGRLQVVATRDMNDGNTSAIRTSGSFAVFIPVLPLYRTVFLSVGVAAAIPFIPGDRVPLHQLVNLGGTNTLRGYVADRYLDRLGWWATAEYRFKFYEYEASSMQLSAAAFVDTGKVGAEPVDLVKGTLPWSVGVNIRAEQNLVLLGRLQVAFSPDGFRFSVGLGEVL